MNFNQVAIITALALLLFITGCQTISSVRGTVHFDDPPPHKVEKTKDHPGPPSHAKAHGYRAKHSYRYYPDASVYFDSDRELYFYLDSSSWRVSVNLPDRLRIELGHHVSIELDTERPYDHYKEHRQKYPGDHKKKKKKKGKDKK